MKRERTATVSKDRKAEIPAEPTVAGLGIVTSAC